jgi:hypothetical protein
MCYRFAKEVTMSNEGVLASKQKSDATAICQMGALEKPKRTEKIEEVSGCCI